MLCEIIDEFNIEEKSKFIKFITGSPFLPIGGLSSLKPQLTIALRIPENNNLPDNSLPSVMTCSNYLKIPLYSNKEIFKKNLLIAINYCSTGFELT